MSMNGYAVLGNPWAGSQWAPVFHTHAAPKEFGLARTLALPNRQFKPPLN